MKSLFYLLGIPAILFSCTGIHGSGNLVKETRPVEGFDKIKASSAIEVEFTNGTEEKVVVEGDDNVIKFIETKVHGGVLEVSLAGGHNFSNATHKVTVTAPGISGIDLEGACSFTSTNTVHGNGALSIESSGASTIEAEIDAPEVRAKVSGASTVKLKGKTRNYEATLSGSSTLEAGDLLSEITRINAEGASTATVFSSISLDAEAGGASTIHYKGSGVVHSKANSASTIEKE